MTPEAHKVGVRTMHDECPCWGIFTWELLTPGCCLSIMGLMDMPSAASWSP